MCRPKTLPLLLVAFMLEVSCSWGFVQQPLPLPRISRHLFMSDVPAISSNGAPSMPGSLISTPAMTPERPSSASVGSKRFASAMALLTGWGQVAAFLKYQTFPTMMTGNTMWLARSFTEGNLAGAAYYLSVIGAYMLGLVLFQNSMLRWKEKSLTKSHAPLVALLFIGSDLLMDRIGTRWLPVSMLAAGFGIVNSVGQEVSGSLTFVITGHYSRIVSNLVARWNRQGERKKFRNEESVKAMLVIGNFFAGSMIACAARASLLPHWMWQKSFTILGMLYSSLFLYQGRDALFELRQRLVRVD